MSQPNMAKVREFHPENFDVSGNLKDEANLDARIEALENMKEKIEEDLEEALAEQENLEKNAPEKEEEEEAQEAPEEEASEETPKEVKVSNKLNIAQLTAIAKQKGISLSDGMKKKDMLKLLK